MNGRQWLEGLLLPHRARREFLRWACEGGQQDAGLRALIERRGSARERARRIDGVVSACDEKQIEIVTPADAPYPRDWLDCMTDSPVALFARGDTRLLTRADSVAVVGARKATTDGLLWSERCGGDLARAGCVVVSGLAYGIDAAAHRGCLAAGGAALAVLGTGVDQAYPPEHAELQLKIQERGCLLSELPPGFGPRPWNFVARNRIIAGLGHGLVVVEAGRRSGTLSTVGFAQDLGREVLVVPGSPGRPQHEGTLELARQGAPIVRDARDVLEDLRLVALEAAAAPLLPGGLAGPARVEEIAAAAQSGVPEMLAALGALEIEGRVRRLAGGYYLPAEPGAQSR